MFDSFTVMEPPHSSAERPLSRVLSVHTKNFVEGESIRDLRNRRVFDSLVRNGSLKTKADMVVVSVKCEGGGDEGAEAVFVSCDCPERDEVVFHISKEELSDWIVLDGDYKFHRVIKLKCSCLESTRYKFKVMLGRNVYENGNNTLSKFYIDDTTHRAKIKIYSKCKCDEFVISMKRARVAESPKSNLPVFPYFTLLNDAGDDGLGRLYYAPPGDRFKSSHGSTVVSSPSDDNESVEEQMISLSDLIKTEYYKSDEDCEEEEEEEEEVIDYGNKSKNLFKFFPKFPDFDITGS